jgi:hypothetical protein
MKGSCLCGAVAYEVDPFDMKIGHCSCRTCRKAQAAPFAATARVPREKFRFLSGEDKLTSFESSPGWPIAPPSRMSSCASPPWTRIRARGR